MSKKHQIGISMKSVDIEEHFEPESVLKTFVDNKIEVFELTGKLAVEILEIDYFSQLKQAVTNLNVIINSIHIPCNPTTDISSSDLNIRKHACDMARRYLALAAELNCRCVVLHPGYGEVVEENRTSHVQYAQESLIMLEKYAQEYDMKIAVENLNQGVNGLGRKTLELISIVDATDSDKIGICMDTNHANITTNPINDTHDYGSRIITVHISDNNGIPEEHLLPGLGNINWEKWQLALLASGYQGHFIYELAELYNQAKQKLSYAEKAKIIYSNAQKYFNFKI